MRLDALQTSAPLRHPLLLWIAVALGALAAVDLAAQSAGDTLPARTAQAATSRTCFQPQPLPACRSFWISEFGIAAHVTSPRTVQETIHSDDGSTYEISDYPPRTLVLWEVGRMANRSNGSALGGGFFIAIPPGELGQTRFGIRGRYHRWLSNGTAVEIGPGVMMLRTHQQGDVHTLHPAVGISLQGAYSAADWLGAVGQAEATRHGIAVQLGGRLAGRIGALSGLVVPVIGLAAFVLLPG